MSWPSQPSDPESFPERVIELVSAGGRFAGLFATANGDDSTDLRAVVAIDRVLHIADAHLPPGVRRYRALTPRVESADWYEREVHDLFGVEAIGHPHLDALVLPQGAGAWYPRPGTPSPSGGPTLDPVPLPVQVSGEGVFTIPYGPVRSGVFERVEYLVETSGEEIPRLRTRVHYKHRGVERRFGELPMGDVVLMAERVEGTASVAHAVALCQALEALGGEEPSRAAQALRLIHAELERVAAHVDSMLRHTEAAGQAVASARLSVHKERVMRLRATLCGHRFGRGVVVPGGVVGPPLVAMSTLAGDLGTLERALLADIEELHTTASFLDRLKSTGPLPREVAAERGALGPIGRGSGCSVDVRVERPYGAYRLVELDIALSRDGDDALSRQIVRLEEIRSSFRLIRDVAPLIEAATPDDWLRPLRPGNGCVIEAVESPQGELLYLVEVVDGRIRRVKPRCASFHNLALFAQCFRGDILTDFAFIEASFGLSIAGVAG
jgi:formate hydrogenlyase subunit 5